MAADGSDPKRPPTSIGRFGVVAMLVVAGAAPFVVVATSWKSFTTLGSLYYFYGHELEFRTIASIMAAMLWGPTALGVWALRRSTPPSASRSPSPAAWSAALLCGLSGLAIGYNYFPALPWDLGWLRPTYGPYIRYGAEGSMLVSWDTATKQASQVRWGRAGGPLDQEAVGGERCDGPPEPSHHHCVRLPRLEPGARYAYTVPSLGEPMHEFRAAPPPGSDAPVVFAAMGDTQKSARAKRDIARLLRQDPEAYDFMLIAGDVVHWDNGHEEWNALFAHDSIGGLASELPLMTAGGNHETYCAPLRPSCPPRATFELRFQNDYPHDGRIPPGADRSGYYYSFDHGDVHVAVVDNFEAPWNDHDPHDYPGLSAAQLTWLEQDLAGTAARWKFLAFHVPLYTVMATQESAGFIAQLEPLIERHDVAALFYGHEHALQVFRKPLDDAAGVYHFLVGGGGGTLEMYHYPRWGEWRWPAPRMDRESMGAGFARAHASDAFLLGENDHHFMKVKILGDTATFTILRLPGGEPIAEYVSVRPARSARSR
jgi:hypothetical protein